MQDYPPFAENGSRERRDRGYEPRETGDVGAGLWIAAVVIALALLSLFANDNLQNGGAPFVITPPNPAKLAQPGGL